MRSPKFFSYLQKYPLTFTNIPLKLSKVPTFTKSYPQPKNIFPYKNRFLNFAASFLESGSYQLSFSRKEQPNSKLHISPHYRGGMSQWKAIEARHSYPTDSCLTSEARDLRTWMPETALFALPKRIPAYWTSSPTLPPSGNIPKMQPTWISVWELTITVLKFAPRCQKWGG